MIVDVYRNLHKKCWSVRDRETMRVVAHLLTLSVSGARLIVSEAGRQRVLREGKKNVHAMVRGFVCRAPMNGPIWDQSCEGWAPEAWVGVRYHPLMGHGFRLRDDETVRVDTAHCVKFYPDGKVRCVVDHATMLGAS